MNKKQLHICIVTGDFPALTETFITNKVLELSKRGHRVTVIKNSNTGINKSHEAQVKQLGIEVIPFPSVSSPTDLLSSPSLLSSFSMSKNKFKSNLQLSLLTKYNYDIIHFEFSGLALTYLNSIKKLAAKTVVSCRGTAEKVKPLSDINRKKNLQQLFTLVDKIHCVSDDMGRTITRLGADEHKIFVNRPSIDAGLFQRKNEYKSPVKKAFVILTIGRLTFQKGYLIGLLAVKELKAQGQKFTWKIVGDGPQMEEMIFHINALDLSDCVELCGSKSRDEILELYHHADLFFLPSVYEGIANVCLEAMSMELPLLSTKSGGMEEVINNGVNGLLCDVYDVQGMVGGLLRAMLNFEERKQMGLNARQTIMNRFTLSRQVDVFEQQYAKLLNEGSN